MVDHYNIFHFLAKLMCQMDQNPQKLPKSVKLVIDVINRKDNATVKNLFCLIQISGSKLQVHMMSFSRDILNYTLRRFYNSLIRTYVYC